MTDSELTPHFKYGTILCFQNKDIFSIDRPTRYRSVYKNDQHVQGWNPATNFFNNRKNSKENRKIDKN